MNVRYYVDADTFIDSFRRASPCDVIAGFQMRFRPTVATEILIKTASQNQIDIVRAVCSKCDDTVENIERKIKQYISIAPEDFRYAFFFNSFLTNEERLQYMPKATDMCYLMTFDRFAIIKTRGVLRPNLMMLFGESVSWMNIIQMTCANPIIPIGGEPLHIVQLLCVANNISVENTMAMMSNEYRDMSKTISDLAEFRKRFHKKHLDAADIFALIIFHADEIVDILPIDEKN